MEFLKPILERIDTLMIHLAEEKKEMANERKLFFELFNKLTDKFSK